MATYPNNIFSPREKQNRSGVEYDPEKKTVIFVEDIKKLDDEVVAIEEELGLHFKRDRMDPNLVLYLPFEENTGTMTKDLSGWGNHGALINGPSWTNGKVGKCLSFDGSGKYVDCGKDSSLNIGNEFTMEGWVKPNSSSNLMGYFGKRNDSSDDFYVLQLGSNNNLECRFRNSNGNYFDVSPKPVITPNVWNHIVFLKNGNEIKAYLNGSYVGRADVYGLPANTNNYYIGKEGIHPFSGLIDEVRFYNRALSESEIQDHYLNP